MRNIARFEARQRGFTLIEIMVAMVIMGIVALLSWRGLDSTTRASAQLDRTTADTLALVHAFEQLERDIAWRSTIEVPVQMATFATGGQVEAARVTASVAVQRAPQGALGIEIIRTATTPGTWQRVQWWRAGTTLYRAAAAPSDVYPLPLPSPAATVVAIQGVIGFDVRALQAGRGWVALPASGRTARTLALEFTITQGTPSQPLRYRRVLALR